MDQAKTVAEIRSVAADYVSLLKRKTPLMRWFVSCIPHVAATLEVLRQQGVRCELAGGGMLWGNQQGPFDVDGGYAWRSHGLPVNKTNNVAAVKNLPTDLHAWVQLSGTDHHIVDVTTQFVRLNYWDQCCRPWPKREPLPPDYVWGEPPAAGRYDEEQLGTRIVTEFVSRLSTMLAANDPTGKSHTIEGGISDAE